jgi:hypothetical protein
MSAATAFADPNPARTQLRVATLDAWARAGVEMADRVASEAGRDILEVVRIVARLIQAVRLAIVLATRLSDPTNPAFQPTPARPRAARGEREPVERPERIRPERPRDREISDAAILRRPLIDIVKVICRNLGIVPDWSLWVDDDAPPAAAPPPPDRPRPEPIPRPSLLQGVVLDRVLGKRLTWISPTQQRPPARGRPRMSGGSTTPLERGRPRPHLRPPPHPRAVTPRKRARTPALQGETPPLTENCTGPHPR